MWSPRMSCLFNSLPDDIQTLEPLIRRSLIPDLPPKPLLEVQPRLITWQIFQVQPCVSLNKKFYLFSSVPSSPIDIKPDRVALESTIEISHTANEPLSISLRPPYHTISTKQRGDPSEDIQPLTVLACGRDPKSLPSLRPPDSKARMQGESRLILKDDRFLGAQNPEFFLEPSETAWPLRSLLADKYIRLVSADIQAGASSSEPDEPSTLFQTGVSSEPPEWDRPTGHDLSQTPKETSPDAPPISDVIPVLNVQDVPTSLPAQGPSTPGRLLCASKDSSFDASLPRPRQSIPVADPPISAEEPLSLFHDGLQGFAEPWLVDALGLLRDVLTLSLGFSCLKGIISIFICQIIYCVCIR